MPKRPRRRRPPPPPPPPEALVELLQNDSSVLAYFQSLQQNLQADVDVWKARAKEWQQKYEDLAKKKPQNGTKKRPLPEDEGESIHDNMFDVSSSDEDEPKEATTANQTTVDEEHAAARVEAYQTRMVELLQEAQAALDRLGIALVDERPVQPLPTEDGVQVESALAPTFIPRSNLDVFGDILSTIRTLCRIHVATDNGTLYAPFDADTALPVLDVSTNDSRATHPACEGYRLLDRVLQILDAFSDVPENVCGRLDDRVALGLRHRQGLVEQLMQTLCGEVMGPWAEHERSLHHRTKPLQFSSSAVLSGNPPAFTGGSKNSQARLSILLERYWMARMVTGYCAWRDRPERVADLLHGYLVSSCATVEESPESPPVLSLVVLCGLLRESVGTDKVAPASDVSDDIRTRLCGSESNQAGALEALELYRCVVSTAVQYCAALHRVRLLSNDERIRDVAQVELASYHRLQTLFHGDGLGWDTVEEWKCESLDTIRSTARRELDQIIENVLRGDKSSTIGTLESKALELAIVLLGDFQRAKRLLDSSLSPSLGSLALAASGACRQLTVRRLEEYRDKVEVRNVVRAGGSPATIMEDSLPIIDATAQGNTHAALNRLFDLSLALANGAVACETIKRAITVHQDHTDENDVIQLYHAIQRAASAPLVRVINLQARSDRLAAFYAQAMRERLYVVKAVAELTDCGVDCPAYYYGGFAKNGVGRMAEVHDRLVKEFGSVSRVHAFVNPHWRPNNLKPFDKDAPTHEGLVKMTDSEVACALSHIASWKGALRSFEIGTAAESDNRLFRNPRHWERLFRLGGFARGPAFLPQNHDMPPAPVCIILEDDAILVDRFRERLAELLVELPRDFHFCSLGYGRPKTAPIVPYATHCGIPSHQFYLTGYVLSLAGAHYLLESLPVVGPVDAWMGLKMTANFDNAIGTALCVGSQSKPLTDTVSHKDLHQMIRFRAFCARLPLCSQRVAAPGSATLGRSWRQRDTDIVYSGDQVPILDPS